jgi:hypothetical protein
MHGHEPIVQGNLDMRRQRWSDEHGDGDRLRLSRVRELPELKTAAAALTALVTLDVAGRGALGTCHGQRWLMPMYRAGLASKPWLRSLAAGSEAWIDSVPCADTRGPDKYVEVCNRATSGRCRVIR